MFTKIYKPQETQNIVSFPILGSLGIRSAKTKEKIAKVPAVQKTKKGDISHKKPRPTGKKIAAIWFIVKATAAVAAISWGSAIF